MSVHSILIVDDHREVRRLLRLALEGRQNGYRVLDVPSGEEAILVSTRQPVDLLLADVRLAGMSGIELASKMKARRPEMRVILISGIPRDEIQEQIDRLHADGFYPKPLDLSKLAEDIERLLGEKAGRRDAPELEAQAVKLEAAVQPVPEPRAAEQPEPQRTLDALLQQFGAASLLLMGSQGQFIAQAGGRGSANLPAAVQAQMDGFTRFVSLLASDTGDDVARLWGETFSLCLIRRAELVLMAFFFDPGSDEQRLAVSRRFAEAAHRLWPRLVQAAALGTAALQAQAEKEAPVKIPGKAVEAPGKPANLNGSRKQDVLGSSDAANWPAKVMDSPVAAPPQQDNSNNDEAGERADAADAGEGAQEAAQEAAAEELTVLFTNGKDIDLDTGELNNFWETAAEDIGDVPTNSSAISYDQAMNLGLTPEDTDL